MKRVMTLSTVVVLALATSACSSGTKTTAGSANASRTKVTLTLNWVPYGEHAPFYYGLKKGFYSAEGIDLTIKSGTGSGNTILQVSQNKTTFGWADTPPLLQGISKGMKVKSVGVFLQKGPSAIEFLDSKNIKKPSDLKGKTVGGTPGDALYAMFPAWLKANGMSKDDVKVADVDAPSKIAALIDGRVDAIMGFFHDQAPTIEGKTGKKVSYLLYADWGMNLLGTGIVVNTDTLSQNPDLVKKFVRATQKSWAEAAKDIPGAVDSMAGVAEQAPPKEVMTKQLTLAVGLLATDSVGQPGTDTEAKWTETIDLMTKYANLSNPGRPDSYWDSSYAGKV
jgi:NitT/TauT family transport system substrate-binding protein